jgi:hypothetical protein
MFYLVISFSLRGHLVISLKCREIIQLLTSKLNEQVKPRIAARFLPVQATSHPWRLAAALVSGRQETVTRLDRGIEPEEVGTIGGGCVSP